MKNPTKDKSVIDIFGGGHYCHTMSHQVEVYKVLKAAKAPFFRSSSMWKIPNDPAFHDRLVEAAKQDNKRRYESIAVVPAAEAAELKAGDVYDFGPPVGKKEIHSISKTFVGKDLTIDDRIRTKGLIGKEVAYLYNRKPETIMGYIADQKPGGNKPQASAPATSKPAAAPAAAPVANPNRPAVGGPRPAVGARPAAAAAAVAAAAPVIAEAAKVETPKVETPKAETPKQADIKTASEVEAATLDAADVAALDMEMPEEAPKAATPQTSSEAEAEMLDASDLDALDLDLPDAGEDIAAEAPGVEDLDIDTEDAISADDFSVDQAAPAEAPVVLETSAAEADSITAEEIGELDLDDGLGGDDLNIDLDDDSFPDM